MLVMAKGKQQQRSQRHPHYERANRIWAEEGFDRHAEGCAKFYAEAGETERGSRPDGGRRRLLVWRRWNELSG